MAEFNRLEQSPIFFDGGIGQPCTHLTIATHPGAEQLILDLAALAGKPVTFFGDPGYTTLHAALRFYTMDSTDGDVHRLETHHG